MTTTIRTPAPRAWARTAIVGAGIAGLSCATRLAAAGHEVCVFDKGRGPGGRMSTRRMPLADGEASFDHGAQYFTAHDPGFVAQVAAWEADGVVARWPAAGDNAWVGTPGMNAPVRALAAPLDVRWSTRVDALADGADGSGARGRWRLDGEALDASGHDRVVVAVPAEQVSALLRAHAPAFAGRADATASQPCWTVMAAFDAPLPIPDDTLRGGDDDIIGWAARDSAKPGRAAGERWVLQATPAWSQAHLEDDATTVVAALLAALAARRATALPAPSLAVAHRWRYARSGGGSAEGGRFAGAGALWDPAAGIGCCGDWLLGPRVEAAWLSGLALADAILALPA